MYKTNDLRSAIKISENKEFDYSKMFDDFEENNDWERFRLVKPAEEEIKERESSEEPQLFKRKRGRPRSLQRIDGKIRKKMVVNTRESKDVSLESESSEEESKKSKDSSEDVWKESLEKKKLKKVDSSFSEENEDAPKKKRGKIPRKLIKNSEREDFEDLRTRRERMLEKRKKEDSDESHKKRRDRRAKESDEFDDWDKVNSDKKKRRAEEDLKRKEIERRRKQEYDMMFNEEYVGELTTKNREHGMVMGSERKKKHEYRGEEYVEIEMREELPPMEEESQHDEFVIELEITEDEKSLEENASNNKKVENYNTPITKPNKKNEKEKVLEKEKPKKMPEIVEIDDEDDVQILNPKVEKNIWVNTENDENKINFDFDHELEDSLE